MHYPLPGLGVSEPSSRSFREVKRVRGICLLQPDRVIVTGASAGPILGLLSLRACLPQAPSTLPFAVGTWKEQVCAAGQINPKASSASVPAPKVIALVSAAPVHQSSILLKRGRLTSNRPGNECLPQRPCRNGKEGQPHRRAMGPSTEIPTPGLPRGSVFWFQVSHCFFL